MVHAALVENAHVLHPAEATTLRTFLSIPPNAQLLFLRIYLRTTNNPHPVSHLRHYPEIVNIQEASDILLQNRLLHTPEDNISARVLKSMRWEELARVAEAWGVSAGSEGGRKGGRLRMIKQEGATTRVRIPRNFESGLSMRGGGVEENSGD